MKRYLLDANIFIEAYRRYYQRAIVPSFWEFLTKDEDIYTIRDVKDDIAKGTDNLKDLIKGVRVFQYSDLDFPREIPDFIKDNYTPEHSADFLSKSDFPLVCVAKSNNFIVVTHEALLSPDAQKVSIPNVCREFGVAYRDTFKMLIEKGINLCNYGSRA